MVGSVGNRKIVGRRRGVKEEMLEKGGGGGVGNPKRRRRGACECMDTLGILFMHVKETAESTHIHTLRCSCVCVSEKLKFMTLSSQPFE